ncbi:hypothetical protein QJS10_CPA03g01860 [Acorus calamus]|uniref:Uncharacterized protein n=1 Tax=Acorus calamus TaxID=4465 RepID=A0AAV9FAD3_ACOCL|nr:hypothetical protein QJS10_CPA03g01860 [Acorus calamus]
MAVERAALRNSAGLAVGRVADGARTGQRGRVARTEQGCFRTLKPAGVLAGVFGTAATGYILQHGSWDDVFKVSVGLYIVGTVVWNLFSTGEKILD